MDVKKWKSAFQWLFQLGLLLAVFVSVDLRFQILPDFYSGLLGGVAATLLLGAGTLKNQLKEPET